MILPLLIVYVLIGFYLFNEMLEEEEEMMRRGLIEEELDRFSLIMAAIAWPALILVGLYVTMTKWGNK